MTNFLTQQDKKQIKKEYIFRFVTVLLWLGIFVMVIASAILFVPYNSIYVENKFTKDQVDKIEFAEYTKDRKNFEEASISLNEKIKNFSDDVVEPSLIMQIITSNVNAGISIEKYSITFSNIEISKGKTDQMATIEISGIAKGRADLVNFQDLLETQKVFDTVDVPYSNFTKNENINFDLNIKTVGLNEFLSKSELGDKK